MFAPTNVGGYGVWQESQFAMKLNTSRQGRQNPYCQMTVRSSLAGLEHAGAIGPALKRWAILGRPAGQETAWQETELRLLFGLKEPRTCPRTKTNTLRPVNAHREPLTDRPDPLGRLCLLVAKHHDAPGERKSSLPLTDTFTGHFPLCAPPWLSISRTLLSTPPQGSAKPGNGERTRGRKTR